jgi:hypothetical protein
MLCLFVCAHLPVSAAEGRLSTWSENEWSVTSRPYTSLHAQCYFRILLSIFVSQMALLDECCDECENKGINLFVASL